MPPGGQRLAIVSGASSGIGWHVARQLLAGGAVVLAIARDAARLQAARDALGALGAGYHPAPLDVQDASGVAAACRAAIGQHGSPGWVVACAGVARMGRFLDVPPAEHEQAWRTNYLGSLNLAQACLPAMVAARRGRLVLVSSAAALGTFYGFSAYAPSKAALRALGDILALEMAPHGVSVTTAYPPDTDTPQLQEERAQRPPVTRAFLGRAPVLAPACVAREVLRGAAAGKRELAIGAGPRWLLAWPRGWMASRRPTAPSARPEHLRAN